MKGNLLEQDVERAILYLEYASAFGSFEAASLLQVLYLSHDPSLIHDDAFHTTFRPFGNMAIQNDGTSEISKVHQSAQKMTSTPLLHWLTRGILHHFSYLLGALFNWTKMFWPIELFSPKVSKQYFGS
ncbi:hypothetical protein OAP14_05165 [Aliiglaciecola sp.]|nr:hypothetical protein [Aliiglaciecola sp.]